jgi:hypothetical protein
MIAMDLKAIWEMSEETTLKSWIGTWRRQDAAKKEAA